MTTDKLVPVSQECDNSDQMATVQFLII